MKKLINLIFNIFKSYKKREIIKKISKIASNKVMMGIYKSMVLDTDSKFSGDLPSKLLGLYEEPVQKKILEIAQKKKLKYLINFGAADGYHVIGLIKKKIFKKALAFEIDKKVRKRLKNNIIKNKVSSRINILGKASFTEIYKILKIKNLKDCLYLVDIEGDEFALFNKDNLRYFKNSFLIIENHENLNKSKKKLINSFFKILEKNFFILRIQQNEKNPFKIKYLNEFDEDLKWLIMSECRPTNQDWIFCVPKYTGI